MMNNIELTNFQRAGGAVAQREQICNLVADHMEYSERHFWGIRAKWPRLYDLWRGNWSGRFHPHKNNVHIPLIFSAIWADAARKVATSLADYPIVSFLGYGPDDMQTARKREALISAQMKDDQCFLKQVDAVVSADLYGVAVMQVGWKKDEPMRIVEYIDRAPLSGKIVRHIKKQKVVMFDGPESTLIDLLDFFPQPAVPRLKDMKWVVRRYFLDLDDLRYLASTGAFDKAELARLEREGTVGPGGGLITTSIRRYQVRVGMDDETLGACARRRAPARHHSGQPPLSDAQQAEPVQPRPASLRHLLAHAGHALLLCARQGGSRREDSGRREPVPQPVARRRGPPHRPDVVLRPRGGPRHEEPLQQARTLHPCHR
jgi:hypothetical protein